MTEAAEATAILKRRCERERQARQEAERLLEAKSRELYNANQALEREAEALLTSREQLTQSLDELRRTQSQLVQASKLEALGTLAGGIAHEINTPVQFINDNLSFLKDSFASLLALIESYEALRQGIDADGTATDASLAIDTMRDRIDVDFLFEEVPLAADQSLQGIGQVAHIVRAMRSFSHRGHGTAQPMDINQAIENAATLCRNEWKLVADLHLDLDAALAPVTGHEAELNQVFLNLIVNAAQALEDADPDRRGVIRIASRQQENTARIAVSDNGPGIPAYLESRVFDPFFTTKDVGRGTGQGLAIAHDIVVQKHGGRLSIEPTEGGGATFLIELPITKDGADTTAAA